MKAATIVIVFLTGLGFALNTVSCQNLCPATGGTGGSGGSSGSSGASGASGSNGTSTSSDCSTSANAGSAGAPTTCAQLTALQACLSSFCQTTGTGSGTPFCTCYNRGGYDLSAAPDCACTPFNAAEFCSEAAANGVDASSIDCSAATSPLVSMCVGVR